MFYRHPFRKRNALEGKKGPAFFENAIFLRFVKRRNELRLIPCQGKKKKTNKEEKQTFVPVAQLTGKNLERKGFETGEKRSPNVIGSPRPLSLSLSLLYLLSTGRSFNRRLSCFRWACTGAKTGSRFFRFLPTEMRRNPPRPLSSPPRGHCRKEGKGKKKKK